MNDIYAVTGLGTVILIYSFYLKVLLLLLLLLFLWDQQNIGTSLTPATTKQLRMSELQFT